MYYYRNNDGVVEKYEVFINREAIEVLKNKIIKDCSFIEHKEFTANNSIKDIDKKYIRNFRMSKVENDENNEEKSDLFFYSFDQYTPPYLVNLIDRLLNNDVDAISEIYDYDTNKEITIDSKIRKVNKELYETKIDDIEGKRAKLKELEELLNAKELNNNQLSVSLYYPKVLSLIRFNIVDSLQLSDLERFNRFLGTNFEFDEMFGDIPITAFKKTLHR